MVASAPGRRELTTYPMMTGTSVVGLKYEGGVMLAADTLSSFGSLATFKNVRRLAEVSEGVLLGASGEYSDFQAIVQLLKSNALEESCASGLYDESGANAKETWNYLRAVMYNRRNKMDPLWSSVLVAGRDEHGKSFLGYVDKIGMTVEENLFATGMGSYLVLSLLREKYKPDLQEGEARALLEDCMRVLFYRDARSTNRIQLAKVSEDTGEVLISEPYELETQWDETDAVTAATALDGDGGW